MSGRRRIRGNGASTQRQLSGSGEAPKPPATEPTRHLRGRRTPRWLKITSAGLALVLVAGIGFAAFLFLQLQGNIKTEDLNAGLNGQNGPVADDDHDPIQILIMGTDTRSGQDASYGSEDESSGYGNSDVMMLLNLSADRKNVSVISFPRDLMVPFPGCKNPHGGDPLPAQPSIQLNAALSLGGPGCTVATINAFTGLTIDHFMLADFTAVKDLTAALGGVDVCVSKAVTDPASGLDLPAGKSSISGEQALAFLRTRHAFGNAGDTDRIKAQQAFLASMTRKIKSEGTLTDLPKLYNIANIVTRNLTVDTSLASPAALITMANRLKDIDLSQVSFVTVPSGADPADSNRLVLSEPTAAELFQAVRSDTSLTSPKVSTQSPTAPSSKTTAPATVSYDKSIQPVVVSNASGLPERAAELLKLLGTAGYTGSVQGEAVANQASSQLLYGTGFADVAKDVAALFGIPASSLVSAPAMNGVQLIVGADFATGTKYGSVTVPKDVVAGTADQPIQCQDVNDLPR
ncbi:LCP family protein [Psychromicrobium lacuslunae]|uniref:Transcriptional regulator n=1 Tax=Psychromicrobium lacuslunae TaxID=1618207 RepID=A0A0D4BXJ4_9MICC|nr:LCP family protein [Psychromicrobium lacuslunae]AJT41019.1 transcriptional regulator [Psychromicrobium lacuslunae]